MENSQPFTLSLPQEESDWECEYDETETESFYVTVDVSSSAPNTRAPRKGSHSEGIDAGSPEEQQQEDENGEPSMVDPALQNDEAEPIGEKQSQSASSNSIDRIQILDLHTENPLISYKNRIYSCSWGSTIGTDIFLTSPTALSALPPATQITPMMSLPEFSILGTSCIQLRARPVNITPKADNPKTRMPHEPPPANTQQPVPSTTHEVEPLTQSPTPATPRPVSEQPIPEQSVTEHPPSEQPLPEQPTSEQPLPEQPTSEQSTAEQPAPEQSSSEISHPPQPLKIPLNSSAPNSTRKQASFLESLQAIKTAKGETDQVTVHSTKVHQSYGWRSRRRLEEMAEGMDVEERDGEDGHIGTEDPANAVGEQGLTAQQAMPSPAKRPRRYARKYGDMPKKIGRPRKDRSRVVGPRGGIFRDYVDGEVGETGVAADVSADRTPVRWQEIERAGPGVGDGGGGVEVEGIESTRVGDIEKAVDGDEEGDGEVDVVMAEGE